MRPLVTHVCPTSFGQGGLFGGGERYPFELARAMAEITPTRLVSFGDEAFTVEEGPLQIVQLKTRTLYKGALVNAISERLPAALLKSRVVHLHQWETVTSNMATVIGRALGVKVFVTDHGGAGKNYWRRFRLHKLVNGLLLQSQFAARFYPEFAGKTTVISGGANVHHFKPDSNQRRTEALFVGRLLPHKGIDLLIESVPADLPLRVIGRPYNAEFRERLRRLADDKSVTFQEDASDEEVAEAYRRARVLVLPSVHHPVNAPPAPKAELLGLTLLEAMASATPVVCTRVGGMPEIVRDGVTGHIVEEGDLGALSHAVTNVVRAPAAEWTQMSRAALTHVYENFTWDAVARRCLAAYGNT